MVRIPARCRLNRERRLSHRTRHACLRWVNRQPSSSGPGTSATFGTHSPHSVYARIPPHGGRSRRKRAHRLRRPYTSTAYHRSGATRLDTDARKLMTPSSSNSTALRMPHFWATPQHNGRAARRLVQLSPDNLEKVFFSDNGSTAVEIAIKMAYQYWQPVETGAAHPFHLQECLSRRHGWRYLRVG